MATTTENIAALREKTGAGMMDCKRALDEAGGDITKAQEVLRKKGLADAAKKSSRATKEGLVAAHIAGPKGALIELNCETDFVARTEDFKGLVAKISAQCAEGQADAAAFEGLIKGAIAKLGENITLRRHTEFSLSGSGLLHAYIHGGKAGTVIELSCGKGETAQKPEFVELAKELALQVVGASPKWVASSEVPADVIAKEKEIATEMLLKEGKPADKIAQILPGKLNKFYTIWCLMDQPSVKDASGKTSIKSLVEAASKKLGDTVAVKRFVRYQLGGE